MKLIFLHGSAGSKRNFKYLLEELKEFECIAFDLIGYGQAKKPKIRYDSGLFVNYISKRVGNINDLVIIGHSLGAILAKEYALKNETKKIFLINYPMKKEIIKKYWLNKMFINKNISARLLCHTKVIWKYLFYPYFLVFKFKYFQSFQDYFKHSFHSENSTLHNVLLKDEIQSLEKIKNKVVFITGEEDLFVDKMVTRSYKQYFIKKMKHSFFGHEEEIARIIKTNIK